MLNKPTQPISGRKKYNAAAIVAEKQRICVETGTLPSIREKSIAMYLSDEMPHRSRKKAATTIKYHFFKSASLLVMLLTGRDSN